MSAVTRSLASHLGYTLVPMRLRASAQTDVGKRKSNEDAFGIDTERGLFIVADGMGAKGHVASRVAVETLTEAFVAQPKLDPLMLFDDALSAAVSRIDAAGVEEDAESMAATIAAVAIRPSGVTVAHVGDSRVYRLRRRRLARLTRDHSVVSDIEMTLGVRVESRAAHPMGTILTRALGGGGDARPDVHFVDVAAHDRYLVCSDGLTDSLREADFRPLLARGTPEDAAAALIAGAVEAGARDNVTALVVDVVRVR